MRGLLFLINLHIVLMVCLWTLSAATASPTSSKLSMSSKSPASTKSPTKSPTSSKSPPPFSVDCKTKTLTLTNSSTQTIVGTEGCSVHNGSKTFQLDEPCLSTGIIVLEKTNPKNGIVTEVARYNVSCEDDEGFIMVVNSTSVAVQVNDSSATPTPFPVSPNVHAATEKVHLMLLRTDPITAILTTTNDVKMAQLGDPLFLTLFSEETDVNVIPLSCMAEVDKTHSINATLWQLHNSKEIAKDCYIEEQVMKSKFSRKNGTNVYVAEIEAFRFRDNQYADIVFSCKVRVCSTETGLCGREKDDVERCSSGVGGSHNGRRRRSTGESELTRGRVDHVTARLRVIVDNGVTYGGATRATFTVTSLILTAIAMVML